MSDKHHPATSLTSAHLRLIDALTERLVENYLTGKTAPEQAKPQSRTKPVRLLPVEKAA